MKRSSWFSQYSSLLAIIGCLVTTTAVAQTWNYQSYNNGGIPQAPGYITLEGKGDASSLRMFAGTLNNCYNRELKASVTQSDGVTIITPVPALVGCEEVRFVIKNDGTGGRREVKRASDWVWDGLERRLTPRT